MQINILLHILILFTFLTILFFTFISKTERNVVNDKLNSSIDDQTPVIFAYIDTIDKKTTGGSINWSKVSDKGAKLQEKYKDPDPSIQKHNKNLIYISVGIIVGIFLLLIGLTIYYKIYKKYDINIGEILLENVIVFAFVGAIEVLFFLNIALKYVPVTTADMANDIIDRVEYQANSQLSS